MTTHYTWRVKAAGDDQYYTTITESEDEPTIIYFNGTHAVVPDSGRIIKTLREEAPRLDSEDGRLMVAPVIHPDYMSPYFTSAGDDFDAGTRGTGELFSYEFTWDGTTVIHTKTFRFVDYVHLIAGEVLVAKANKDDYFSFTITAPATPVSFNGSGLGNCHLYDLTGGYNLAHMIIPADSDGTHDVDLTTAQNSNLVGTDPVFVSCVVPIPANKGDTRNGDGYWDWEQLTGQITPCINRDGHYNLYDFEITLSNYANRIAVGTGISNMVFSRSLNINHRSGPFLPHWVCTITMTTANTHTVGDTVYYNLQLTAARRKSTN